MVTNHRHPTLNNWPSSLSAQSVQYLHQPLFVSEKHSRSSVLVVDPDLTMHTPLCEQLVNLNYYVLTAAGGEEALHLLSSHTIALVLLNIRRSVKDGLSICTALRRSSEVPILILTDLDQLSDAAYALIIGADGYLTRPFTSTTLKIRLRGLLNTSF